MKRLLLVTPHWLPFSAPDLQRVRLSLPHYRRHGWDPIVLGVDAAYSEGLQEPDLLPTVPADVPVHRCRALPARLTRRVGLGNLGWRCLPYLYAEGARLIAREHIDLVLMSTTQFVTLTAARAWSERLGVPYVVDLQDPWRTDDYERPGAPPPPGGRKYRFARLVAWALEERTFRTAAGFISVSETYLTRLRARYSWMRRRPAVCIPFGGSRDDLALANTLPAGPENPFSRNPGEVHLVYTGAAGPLLPDGAARLLTALKVFRSRRPREAERLRLHFLGTHYAPAGHARPVILPLAEHLGVADQVSEIPHRLGYLATLRLQQASDGLLLTGSRDPAYVPSKLVPYALSGRPLLAVVTANTPLHHRLAEIELDPIVTHGADAAMEATIEPLITFFADALAGFPDPRRWRPRESRVDSAYEAATLTGRQCRLFDQIHPGPHASLRQNPP